MLASSILRMVIVRIPEDHGWVPAYPTSGTAIEFQFLSLFVVVSFLKVRVRARARKAVSVRSREPISRSRNPCAMNDSPSLVAV